MPPTMLASVPTRPRSHPFRRRRGAAAAAPPLLPDQIAAAAAAAAKRPAESSTSASSCFHSEVISATSTTCPEQLANDAETTAYSSAREDLTLSETEEEEEEEEVRSGPCICTDCSFSPLHESSSSSDDDNAVPSPTFSLFLALAEQFVPFTHPKTPTATDVALQAGEGKRFEDLDNEVSYERFRRRERRGVVARDYIEVYSSMLGSYGRAVVEQRVVMVNWIMEHSQAMKLQPETVFMGIGLMDRFLTRGYVKGSRNLQLLGIACTTLATRIEENQPYNCILQKAFKVGINTYSRSEVVAMEWLVQEVLDFQCFVTTTHHFLWFYLKAANADDRVEDLAKYLALLSLLDHKHLSFWPSTVAAAVVALACLATNNESSCHLVMETHMRTKNDDLPECLMSLEWLTNYAS
ncbi:Os03g0225200 [Oryza sativa Japonica Group]|uniref:Os03g0225200 protein n=1 Tax=Oryza sativa subsp. japonica TaxID=39947 RepID=A0A0P0VUW7_ORYSJ|nr:hypothetical protein EE612_016220 [Oryza sativa]BAS83048.1 Os03g0225200 [Oryza sativa Japonica Group]